MLKWCDIFFFQQHRAITVQCVIILTYVADVVWFRERLRDIGMCSAVVELVQQDPGEWEFIAAVYNLSRSECIHISLQEACFLKEKRNAVVKRPGQ